MGFSQCLTNHTDASVSLNPPTPSVPVVARGFVSRGVKAAWPPTSFGGSEGLLLGIPWCLIGIELKMLQPQWSCRQDAFPKPLYLF